MAESRPEDDERAVRRFFGPKYAGLAERLIKDGYDDLVTISRMSKTTLLKHGCPEGHIELITDSVQDLRKELEEKHISDDISEKQGLSDDTNDMAAKLLPKAEILQEMRRRKESRAGWSEARFVLLAVILLVIMNLMTEGGDSTAAVQRVLMNAFVANSTQGWLDIQTLSDFWTWHDEVLLYQLSGAASYIKLTNHGSSNGCYMTNDFLLFLTKRQTLNNIAASSDYYCYDSQNPPVAQNSSAGAQNSSASNTTGTSSGGRRGVPGAADLSVEDIRIYQSLTLKSKLLPVTFPKWTVTRTKYKSKCDNTLSNSFTNVFNTTLCLDDEDEVSEIYYPTYLTYDPLVKTKVADLQTAMYYDDSPAPFVGSVSVSLNYADVNSQTLAYLTLTLDCDQYSSCSGGIDAIGNLYLSSDGLPSIVVYVCFLALCLVGLFITYNLVREVGEQGILAMLSNFSSLVDIATTVQLVALLVTVVMLQVMSGNLTLMSMQEFMYDLEYQGLTSELNNVITSINSISQVSQYAKIQNTVLILTFWVRCVLSLSVEGKLALICRMLFAALNDLFHFMWFMILYLLTFSFVMRISFGSMGGFADVASAFESLIYLGFVDEQYDYDTFTAVQPVLSPILAIAFLVFTGLILFNVFIAILMDAYVVVKEETYMQDSLLDEMWEGVDRRMNGRNYTDVDDVLMILESDERPDDHWYSYDDLLSKLEKPLQPRTDSTIRKLTSRLQPLTWAEMKARQEHLKTNGVLSGGTDSSLKEEVDIGISAHDTEAPDTEAPVNGMSAEIPQVPDDNEFNMEQPVAFEMTGRQCGC